MTDSKTFHQLRRLDARLRELENFNNDMSNYISEIQQDFTDRHDLLVSQVNTFMHEIIVKIEKLEHTNKKAKNEEKVS